jgi:Domain of unknown function (DUF5348)
MPEDTVSMLLISSVRGRYALDDPLHGQDITSGQTLAILLGGHWIEGSIEHAGGLYAACARRTTSLERLLLPGQ